MAKQTNTRRLHTPRLFIGSITLDLTQSRHAKDVLRLEIGDEVELFDDSGATARGVIEPITSAGVAVLVQQIFPAAAVSELVIASAVPKGDRADWMVEKLSEIGVTRFVPLSTERSVVHPEGRGKLDRWARLATESAKQSQRVGVMRIDELTPLPRFVESSASIATGFLTTQGERSAISTFIASMPPASPIQLVIGPEGGWTDRELAMMRESRLTGLRLTTTILRVETAAVVAAAVVACARGTDSEEFTNAKDLS